MNSYKKLVENSAIFAIGRLGSKVITFLLIPLYTYYLSTVEYGTVDLVTTTVNMLLPIISASMLDVVLRFILEDKDNSDVVLMNALSISIIGFTISLLFIPLIMKLNLLGNNLVVVFMYIILATNTIERLFSEYTRAIGEIKIFAINGIILTLSTGLFNILFLVVFKTGIVGYFLSLILSYCVSVFYININTKAYKKLSLSLIDKKIMKVYLKYSIPLVPNSLMWWLINASSRYFVRFFIGFGANGLFAVASKIPAIISIVTQVFMQAWQLSAIEEYKNEKNSIFYSNVFKYLSSTLLLGTSAIILVLKPAFKALFATEYYGAWVVVPFLLLGAVFSSFSGFLGTIYIAAKQTKGVFKTSVYGGIISIVLNLLLISQFGIIGGGISSMLSFLTMWILRLYDTKKYMEIKIDRVNLLFNLILIFVQILILFAGFSKSTELIIGCAIFIILIILNYKIFQLFINLVSDQVNKYRK